MRSRACRGSGLTDELAARRLQVARQVAHWQIATVGLRDLTNFAAESAWRSLERYLDVALRSHLEDAAEQLTRRAAVLAAELRAATTAADLEQVRVHVVQFRRRYLQVETALTFFGEAINSRTTPRLGTLLRACDSLALSSMESVLRPLRRDMPPVLTYVDKGLGASILRAGLRLWDGGTLSPAAAIKITRQNLLRPTALIHESGHQVAHILGWNEELAAALGRGLAEAPDVAEAWSATASEIAADCFAFVHTGYGSVAALHDVVSGGPTVFRRVPGDPHPVAYIRVLLGVEMCVRFYGAGPWDDLARAWVASYPLGTAEAGTRSLLERSLPLLSRIVEICLRTPMRSFGGRPLSAWVDPRRVRPDALAQLARDAGGSIGSPVWLGRESLRLLALSSLRYATEPERAEQIAKDSEAWMLRLGEEPVPKAA
jgi:hypothetical protein